ncbi:MAG: YfaZ family outer membrane protein [Pseudomonadota bacterium]
MRYAILLLISLAMAPGARAAGVALSLSEETGEFTYLLGSRGFLEGGVDIGLSGLYNHREDVLLSAELISLGQQAELGQPWQLGVGMKLYGLRLDDGREMSAVALGARLAYIIPSNIAPTAFVTEGFFAPSVTTFGDAERLFELDARFEVEITPTALGFIGYRLITTRMTEDSDDVEVDDTVHVGIRFNLVPEGFRSR